MPLFFNNFNGSQACTNCLCAMFLYCILFYFMNVAFLFVEENAWFHLFLLLKKENSPNLLILFSPKVHAFGTIDLRNLCQNEGH